MAANPCHHHQTSYFIFTPFIISFFTLTLTTVITPSKAATDTFIYAGCSQTKYSPNTPYQNNVNTLLTSIVNSATSTSFDKYTISPKTSDVVYGLYQCRPDLRKSECAQCISSAVTQLGAQCSNSAGAEIRVDGCYVRYDKDSFLGVEDKKVVDRKCGSPGQGIVGNRGGEVLDDLLGTSTGGDSYYRVGRSGNVKGVAECSRDLSGSQCDDCISEAIERLKSVCDANAGSGDMFLTKCYARYYVVGHVSGAPTPPAGYKSGPERVNDVDRTIAIIIGLISGIALLILFLTFLRNSREEEKLEGK